jgi:hypothetical protein
LRTSKPVEQGAWRLGWHTGRARGLDLRWWEEKRCLTPRQRHLPGCQTSNLRVTASATTEESQFVEDGAPGRDEPRLAPGDEVLVGGHGVMDGRGLVDTRQVVKADLAARAIFLASWPQIGL